MELHCRVGVCRSDGMGSTAAHWWSQGLLPSPQSVINLAGFRVAGPSSAKKESKIAPPLSARIGRVRYLTRRRKILRRRSQALEFYVLTVPTLDCSGVGRETVSDCVPPRATVHSTNHVYASNRQLGFRTTHLPVTSSSNGAGRRRGCPLIDYYWARVVLHCTVHCKTVGQCLVREMSA